MKNQKFQLNKRLAGYSATAFALAAFTANAEGQVVYSGLKNIVVKNTKDSLDIDGDGIKDFSIINNLGISNKGFIKNLQAGNSWHGSASNKWVYAFYSRAYIISTNVFFNGTGLLGGFNSSTSTHSGYFPGQGNKFIGIKFKIGTDTHYGWIRINMPTNVDSVKIIDWAYQKLPDQRIVTGDTAAPVLSGSIKNIGIDTAIFNISSSANGWLYYGVKKATDPVPTIGEIIADTSFITSGNSNVNAGDTNSIELYSLFPNTNYKLYAFVADGSADTSKISSFAFSTAKAITPVLSGVSVNKAGMDTAIFNFTSNVSGYVYFGVKMADEPAPIVGEILADTSLVTFDSYYSLAGAPANYELFNLSPGTSYKIYAFVIDDYNDTSAISSYAFSTASGVGINKLVNENITIYPNPVSNILYITLQEKSEFSIVDASGRMIQTGKLEAGKSEVNIGQLTQGIYFIHINLNDGSTFAKQIIKK